MNQFGNDVRHGFFHTSAFMVFDRMYAQVEPVSDHFTAKTLIAKPDDLQLPRRNWRINCMSIYFGENL